MADYNCEIVPNLSVQGQLRTGKPRFLQKCVRFSPQGLDVSNKSPLAKSTFRIAVEKQLSFWSEPLFHGPMISLTNNIGIL